MGKRGLEGAQRKISGLLFRRGRKKRLYKKQEAIHTATMKYLSGVNTASHGVKGLMM